MYCQMDPLMCQNIQMLSGIRAQIRCYGSDGQMVDLVSVILNMVVQMDCSKISRGRGRHIARPTLRCQDAICGIIGFQVPIPTSQ